MAALGSWRPFLRVREESSYNAATPQTADEWNLPTNALGGSLGWVDAIDSLDGIGLQSNAPLIFPSGKVGQRGMNNITPVAGSRLPELGSITMPVVPDLIIRWLAAIFTTNTITPTAGQAAQSATAFASLATLTTQPNSKEQLVFTVASSTAASSAVINIIQSAATVESINIGTSASSVDGVYYSKGAYDGSVNAITFTVSGTVTSGTVAVSGIDYTSQNFKFASTAAPSLVIEQSSRVEEGAGSSEFFPGCKVPTLQLAFDRNTQDSILLATLGILGLAPTVASSTTYAGDAVAGSKAGYLPFAGWTCSIQLDDVANLEVVSANININGNDELYSVASGAQSPQAAAEGPAEFFADLTVIPTGTTRWDDYQNATSRKAEFIFNTPHFVNGSTPYNLTVTANNVYVATYARANQSAVQSASMQIRGVYNSTDAGAVQVDVVSRMPI